MRIYHPGSRGRHASFIRPGAEYPTADFCLPDGTPKQFRVEFINGVAEVPPNIGQYMLDKGYAQRSPIIIPQGVA